ncbi:MAG: type I glutamate--ammonia ligase [Acidobacteriota bacterium]
MAREHEIAPRDALKEIREKDIRFLDLKFVDLFGTLQHLTVPTEVIDEKSFQQGFGFDGSSVRGFQSIDESDMLLIPDSRSLFLDPFFDDPTLSVFCDINDPVRNAPYSRDPRGIARRAQQLIRSEGLADNAFFGPEIEFFIFDDVRFDQDVQHGYYFLNNSAAFWNTGDSGQANLGHRASRKGSYFAAPPVDRYSNLRSKISSVLRSTGIPTELHHHEVAAAGQCEIGFRFGPLLTQADNSIKFKYVVKNVVDRFGKSATFMPKPLLQENGSGMHMNLSLWKDGKNLFFGAGGYADLSDFALSFIGGVLEHAPALCGICAPTTNSYRRLVPGYEAPMNLMFSQRNRSACVRIPVAGASAKTKRIEFRTPDPSCNPYLGFAAVLLAGVDGVRRKLKPPPPVDENVYALAGTERGASIESTPGSLDEAIDALEADHEFLVRDGVFPQQVIDSWIGLKRQHEIDYIRLRPHPGEFHLYYNV